MARPFDYAAADAAQERTESDARTLDEVRALLAPFGLRSDASNDRMLDLLKGLLGGQDVPLETADASRSAQAMTAERAALVRVARVASVIPWWRLDKYQQAFFMAALADPLVQGILEQEATHLTAERLAGGPALPDHWQPAQ